MYGFMRPRRAGEHRTGYYYTSVLQSLPATERGKRFRFALADSTDTTNEVVENLEDHETSLTITTTFDYNWSCDGSILIDGKLYKIQDGIQTAMVADTTYGLVKSTRKLFTIRLMEIPNPVGLRR